MMAQMRKARYFPAHRFATANVSLGCLSAVLTSKTKLQTGTMWPNESYQFTATQNAMVFTSCRSLSISR